MERRDVIFRKLVCFIFIVPLTGNLNKSCFEKNIALPNLKFLNSKIVVPA